MVFKKKREGDSLESFISKGNSTSMYLLTAFPKMALMLSTVEALDKVLTSDTVSPC